MSESEFLFELHNYAAATELNNRNNFRYRPSYIQNRILYQPWNVPGASTKLKIKLMTEAKRAGALEFQADIHEHWNFCIKIINIISYWQKTGEFAPERF